ncbi:uncharacterized protein LOC131947157 [Physella acuta]|uniref:uncharacterized protein LOC131947157 n=1 Tax=Physella acuta TaxID=109671 RepID=UPI0027DC9602|nr:uncharacterized protein LOC131947157 [Physella acuta]
MIVNKRQCVIHLNRGLKMLSRIVARRVSSLSTPLKKVGPGKYPIPDTPGYKAFMERQTLFLEEDGNPVWKKLPKDNALYITAVSLVSVATIWTAYSLFVFASPPKNG